MYAFFTVRSAEVAPGLKGNFQSIYRVRKYIISISPRGIQNHVSQRQYQGGKIALNRFEAIHKPLAVVIERATPLCIEASLLDRNGPPAEH